MRRITSVNLTITTLCNRACPECCQSIRKRPQVSYDWDYFVKAARWLRGMDRIVLTGGEPTAHPQFRDFVPCFKGLFDCKHLAMETNGYRVLEYRNVMKYFSEVYLTSYKGSNAIEVSNWLASYCDSVHIRSDEHLKNTPGPGGMCHRGYSETVAYSDHRIYPCCVGPGLEGADSIEPSDDWRERIQKTAAPCETCRFSL